MLHLFDISRTLRSSFFKQLGVPKTMLNIGKRAFSVAAQTIRNKVPITINSFETIPIFRKNIKICLFEIAFPP